jgi:hypothetical protein
MNDCIKWLICLAFASVGSVQAQELYKSADADVNAVLEITAAPLFSSFDFSQSKETSVKWMESYIRGGVSGEVAALGGEVYGTVKVLTSKDFGDGDAAGTSTGHESNTVIDSAFLGWKNEWLDLSAGRQGYAMGDYFLIAGDQLAYGDKIGSGMDRGGLYYLAQPTTFAQTAIAKMRPNEHILVEAFHLESNNNGQGSPTLNGINSEFSLNTANLIGVSYIKLDNLDTQRDEGLFALRDKLNVYNLRGETNLGIPALSVEAGYASEQSSKVDADAWYAGASYLFGDAPLTPSVSYRYSTFSGDNPNTGKSEAFDPLFYGASPTGPAWVQGEISGTFAGPFNTNTRAQRVTGQVVLNEKVSFSAMAYRFDTVRDSVHFADELDLYLQTFPTPNLTIIPVLGFWKPQEGAKEVYATNDVQTFFALITQLTF